MSDVLDLGHVARSYETADQRLLGDERFVERIVSLFCVGSKRGFGEYRVEGTCASHRFSPFG